MIGLLFVLAHLPFYLPGQLYEGLPLWPAPIWLLAGSVLLTWIYLNTGSVLLAGLMHAAFNGTVPLTWGLDPAWVWQARAGVLSVIAVIVVLMGGRNWWLSPIRSGATNEHVSRAHACCLNASPSTTHELGGCGAIEDVTPEASTTRMSGLA